MNYPKRIAAELNIAERQAAAAIELFDAGNTLPFIARYRKERTGGLDEEQLRRLKSLLDRLRAVADRRRTIMGSVEQQGEMTPELRERLLAADSLTALEDLYRPYKPKRRTRADAARERGLQGLADAILEQVRTDQTAAELAAPFVGEEVPTVEDALARARDIVAQTISDHPDVRQATRERALRRGMVRVERRDGAEDPQATYQLYYEFKSPVGRLQPHQILAINRGEAEEVLRVGVEVPEREWREGIAAAFRPDPNSPLHEEMVMAAEDAAARLLLPAIERDVRRTLTERAEAHAIRVFAANVRALLSQPPLAGQTVLAIDPGFRTGCKVAVVDASGRVVDTTTIYPHQPQGEWDAALSRLEGLIRKHEVTLLAIGNGTASRETEQLAAQLIRKREDLRYVMVDETGASVYSASPRAGAELPDMDVSLRGAVSIARRVQDPLAELVKIDPRSLGVGMYQHDVNQTALKEALDEVVESVVNRVGVDLNGASPALLTYVAGIGPALAERVVAYRDEHGPFPTREAIQEVDGVGPKTYEQAAGFLRIRGGEQPLDASAIHPESYDAAEALLHRAGLTIRTPPAERATALVALLEETPLDQLSAELDVGLPTLADIFKQLVQPGRDPREDLPAPILRSDVLTMEDLQPHMRLKGTVRNVVDFGAFVDIGVKNDGLLHRSQIPAGAALQVGDVVEVEVLSVEIERGRIGLGWATRPGRGEV
ncbi:MAG: Tex family protein [Chloroflexota bacterium]